MTHQQQIGWTGSCTPDEDAPVSMMTEARVVVCQDNANYSKADDPLSDLLLIAKPARAHWNWVRQP